MDKALAARIASFLVFFLTGTTAIGAVGRTPGSVDLSDTGEGTYSIPIFAPPGTHARVRVTNLDDSLIGQFLRAVNNTQTQVAFTANIDSAQGSRTESFTFRGDLDPGEFSDFPLTESGDPETGPGTVGVTARNLGALDTLVTLAAYPLEGESCR